MRPFVVHYETLIAEIKRRIHDTRMRIKGAFIGFSAMLVATLFSASDPIFVPATSIYGAIACFCAAMFIVEAFRRRGLERDLTILQTDRRNNLPPDRADTECLRAVRAVLAEGGDVPVEIAEAA